MGPMDIVAVYLNVDFTITLKDIVALLQPLQLVFDAVREFVIYVPRGRDIVLRVGFLPRTSLSLDMLILSLFLSGTVGAAQDVLRCTQGPLSWFLVGLRSQLYYNFNYSRYTPPSSPFDLEN